MQAFCNSIQKPFKRGQTTSKKSNHARYFISLQRVGEIMKEIQVKPAFFFRHKIAHDLGL